LAEEKEPEEADSTTLIETLESAVADEPKSIAEVFESIQSP